MRNITIMLLLASLGAFSCGGGGTSKVFNGADKIYLSGPGRCTKVWYGAGDSPEADSFIFGRTAHDPGLTEIRVFAAVFYENPPRVGVSGEVIQNPENTVWIWDSGMVSNALPTDGSLRFTDGTGSDAEGTPISTKACGIEKTCPTLRANKIIINSAKPYFFSMWAWNHNREISYYADDYLPFCWTDKQEDSGKLCDQMDQSYCTVK